MSGKYSRTYSRKKAPAAPPISQFDRLVSEHGKGAHHPVASKTAGHVGKWGITSFTSLRCISDNYGKEDNGKKKRSENTSSHMSESIPSVDTTVVNAQPKRRKFFKSRDYSPDTNSTVSNTNNASCDAMYQSSGSCLKGSSFENPSDLSTRNKPMNLTNSSCQEKASGGGIKLKIFKSRNRDVNSIDTYSSTVQLPSDDSGNSTSNSSSIANSPKSDFSHAESNSVNCPSPNSLNLPIDVETKVSQSSTNVVEMPEVEQEDEPTMGRVKRPLSPKITSLRESRKQSPEKSGRVTRSRMKDKEEPSSDSSQGVSVSKFIDSAIVDNSISTEIDDKIPSTQEDEVGLFSSDFDENDITDRTTIDYQPETSLSISNRIDLAENDSPPPADFLEEGSNIYEAKSQLPLSYESSNVHSQNKKKSIFKSRQKEGNSKKRATYKHKWHGHEEKEDSATKNPATMSSSQPDPQATEDPFDFDSMPLTRVQTWPTSQPSTDFDSSLIEEQPVTRVKCSKQAKKYYTVIKNVKKTHQLQESGEFQEFNDDVEYFLDALRSSNSVSTRCLASLNLAQKCMTPAFRMHLRAHGTVIKFFSALSDAPSHPQVAECAAMVMFALSQDRLNMDLDRSSLELMLNLLDTDSGVAEDNGSIQDHQIKIRALCEELQQKGHAKHLKLDKINAASLAMETLLSLTSKRAGEWFKEELRDLGGVDHLMRTVTSCNSLFKDQFQAWSPTLLEKLSKVDRCLKVLENVTLQNEANQEYLLKTNGGAFVTTLIQIYRMFRKEVSLHPEDPALDPTLCDYDIQTAKTIIATLVTTIKMLINLTHGTQKEALGSVILGKEKDVYDISLYCLLVMPAYLKHDTKFEIQVLACCLLLNLLEYSQDNREVLMKLQSPTSSDLDDSTEIFPKGESHSESAVSSLMTLFYSCEESAREQEAHTDDIIDKDLAPEPSSAPKEDDRKDEDLEETVARLLQKAGRHMEDTLIAAYTALIAAFCLLDNKEFEKEIRLLQPEGHFKTMVAVLKKFLRFMNLTASTTLLLRMKPTERVVKYMEALDRTPEEEAEEARKKKEKEEAAQAMAMEAFGF